MKYNKTFTFAFVLVFAVATFAQAGTVEIVKTENGGGNDGQLNLAGSVTNDILLDSPGTSIFSQQLRLVLTSGSILQHPFGTNTPPNSALIGSFGSLAYDSFVSAGTANNDNGSAPVPGIIGRSDELSGPGGTPAEFGTTGADILYGPALGQSTADQNNYLSARLTLTGDAAGTFYYRAVFGDGVELLMDVPVLAGIIGGDVPPPVNTPPVGVNALIDNVFAGDLINHPFQANDAETASNLLVWSNPVIVGAPAFGGTGVHALGPQLAADGTLTWNTLGSARGIYEITATVTDDGNPALSGTAVLTVNITAVPEPATFGLVGLALVGIVGLVRRRS